MVQKLDAILKLVFDHFSRPWSPNFTPPQTTPSTPVAESPASPLTPLDALRSIPTSTDPERSKAIQRSQFYTLLSIFDRTIIRTFKSRYTQFLLFWFASLDSEYNDLFQGMLVSRALYEHEQPIVTRAAATAYIGSLVSRATFIDREGARKVAAVLCNALRDHLDAHDHLTREGIALPPGAQQHGLFYSVAQAVFLMFCFRWRDLMMDESGEEEVDASVTDGDPAASVGRKWMSELGIMQRVINSSLNPLKVRPQIHHLFLTYQPNIV
jgi:RNA polymerase I-specific transcription initiation factor RRN3